MRARPLVRALALTLAACGPAPGGAAAWPAPLMDALARDARRLLPDSLARLLAEREAAVLEAARRFPPELGQLLARDLGTGRLRAETLKAIEGHLSEAGGNLRQGRVGDGIVRLGATARIPADLSDPALSAGPSGYPPGVLREYYAFVQSNLGKIPVVLDDAAALRLRGAELPRYYERLLATSREQSPVIRDELYSNGRVVDHRRLDFRSPAFGVASLSYSRAVTAIAATWLAVWRDAGGDTTRMPAPAVVQPR